MIDKERLEEIKHKYHFQNLGRFIDSKLVDPNELKWLIQQAERVVVLEERVTELNKEIGMYAGEIGRFANSIGTTVADLKILATRMCKGDEDEQ